MQSPPNAHRHPPNPARLSISAAVVSGLGANLLWGISPLVWTALKAVPAGQVLAHRIIWSVCLVVFGAGLSDARAGLRLLGTDPRLWCLTIASALAVGTNWLINLWAVNAGHVVEASLGYYMSPMLNVLLARLVLGERLRSLQQAACAIVLAGVLVMVWHLGRVPWTGMGLAMTFASYGLLRKRSPLVGTQGFRIETLILVPIALGYLLWQSSLNLGAFELGSARQKFALVFAGIFSGTPLLLFSRAATRLRLTTLGIVQYVMPTCQLMIAVWVFGEPLSGAHAFAFGLIWLGLVLYSGEGLVHVRRTRRLT